MKKISKKLMLLLLVITVFVAIPTSARAWSVELRIHARVPVPGVSASRDATGWWSSQTTGTVSNGRVESRVRGDNACNIAIANGIEARANRITAQASSARRLVGNSTGWNLHATC